MFATGKENIVFNLNIIIDLIPQVQTGKYVCAL